MTAQGKLEEQPQKLRKKYEKPAVIYLAPLEAMATLCDPSPLWIGNAPFGIGCSSTAGKQPPYVCNSQNS